MLHVDIAVFAHNEEASIGQMLNDLARQTIFNKLGSRIRVRILCNGCSDNTVKVASEVVAAQKILASSSRVDNFQEGGKSRTWNRFVSELPADSQVVIFIDGDIRIHDAETLQHLVEELQASDAVAATSRPVKDLRGLKGKPLLRAGAERITRQHEDGPIAGSLYAAKAEIIRQLRLPVPCLVEDGFLSACLITGIFSHDGKPELVKASRRASHYFEAPSSLREFFQHDVRLALGTELNAALYSALWAAGSKDKRLALLQKFSESSEISHCIGEHLSYPERSALKKWAGAMKRLYDHRGESLAARIMRLPVRFAHALYMEVVRCRARNLFCKREFQW